MNMKTIYGIALVGLISSSSFADPIDKTTLQAQREHVIHQYVLDLAKADVQDINSLFMEGGKVVSTSRGMVDSQVFFSSFLPEIEKASTTFHQAFTSNEDINHYAARFYFNYQMHDGEKGEGEYIDEFVFAENSAQLTHVYMFENLKFDQQN